MKSITFFFRLISRRNLTLILFVMFGLVSAHHAQATEPKKTGRVLLKYDMRTETAESFSYFANVNGLEVVGAIKELGVAVAREGRRKLSTQQIQALANSPRIKYAEEEIIWEIVDSERNTPSDPYYADQSGLARMNILNAWQITQGSEDILVAISDTGIDWGHPELINRIWENPGEIAGNGIDDDGNGFVDDVKGWDFSGDDNRPMDGNLHGTHVAGIIGAEGNNADGITGVNWNIRMMAVQGMNNKGQGSTEDLAQTIVYAADNGARVVNTSWGSNFRSKILEDALNYAASKGTLVVAASGNNSADTDRHGHYPSSYHVSSVLSVASTEYYGVLSDFSNFGPSTTDLAAPGSNILSTVLNNGYRRVSGTSMASPMVAGVAALVLSAEPELSMIELRNGLLNAVNKKSAYHKKLSTEGELDAYKAVNQLSQGFQLWPSQIRVAAKSAFEFTAYDAAGVVEWAVTNPSVATISQTGVMQALNPGTITVSAYDPDTQEVRQASVEVVPPPKTRSAPSCFGAANRQRADLTAAESTGAALTMLLPFLFGIGARRRRKDQSEE